MIRTPDWVSADARANFYADEMRSIIGHCLSPNVWLRMEVKIRTDLSISDINVTRRPVMTFQASSHYVSVRIIFVQPSLQQGKLSPFPHGVGCLDVINPESWRRGVAVNLVWVNMDGAISQPVVLASLNRNLGEHMSIASVDDLRKASL